MLFVHRYQNGQNVSKPDSSLYPKEVFGLFTFRLLTLLPVAQLPTANKVTYVCGIPATTLVTCGRYYFTMEEQPTRRLIPHLVWTIAQAIGTTGSCLASKF